MKKIKYLMVAMLLVTSLQAFSQSTGGINLDSVGLRFIDVANTVRTLAPPDDTLEGDEMSRVQVFETFWHDRAMKNVPDSPNMFAGYYKGLNDDIATRFSTSSCSNGKWECIGPQSLPTQRIGYVECIWADPSNANYILAGTYGGLFKTTNGGTTWKCITDNAPIASGIVYIHSICVDPTNHNNIYLGTIAAAGLTSPGPYGPSGASIIKTTNGGLTWTQEPLPPLGDFQSYQRRVQQVYITPDGNRLYAFCGQKIYTRTNSPLTAWVDITPTDAYVSPHAEWYDLEFVPGNQNHFFVSNTVGDDAPQAGVWEYTFNTGTGTHNTPNCITRTHGSITGLTATLTDPRPFGGAGSRTTSETDWGCIDISIPDANTIYIAALDITSSPDGVNPWAGLFIKTLSATSWGTPKRTSMPFDRNPNHLHFHMYVSPAATTNNLNERNIYFGSDIAYQSVNGGTSFRVMQTYEYTDEAHADIRGMCIQTATNTLHGVSDRVYIATDGGVSVKLPGVDVESLKEESLADVSGTGLTCGTFWGIATSEAGGIALGGMMHDGVVGYEPDKVPKWTGVTPSRDSYTSIIDNNDPTKGYVLVDNFRYKTISGTSRQMEEAINLDYPSEGGGQLNRPLSNDKANTQYIGIKDFWYQTSGSTLWNSGNSNIGYGIFSNVLSIANDPRAASFTGYVLSTVGSGNHQQLTYKGPLQPSFANQTLPQDGSYPTTSITADPANISRVWVGIGSTNYADAGHNRVYYSSTNGSSSSSWVDISSGLPRRVPVSRIIYVEGANKLFCSTDVGVYMCDFSTYNPSATVSGYNNSVSWQCYNKPKNATDPEFPNSYVTDLKINHCEGKLYAATYGRSIWSTSIIDDANFRFQPTDEINTNTAWTGDIYINSGILVKSGKVLTIGNGSTTTTLHMPRQGQILVEPGAKLIVNKATLTNSCENCMWGGIVGQGNTGSSQTDVNQSRVELTDATIEHAIVGYKNMKEDGTFTHTGGMLFANTSNFKNCSRSIEMYEYPNSYKGYISRCNFSIDNNYRGGSSAFASHVYLQGVKNVSMSGCNFTNTCSQYVAENAGIGVLSSMAGFKLRQYYSGIAYIPGSPGTRGSFSGFRYGVFAQADGFTSAAIEVDGYDFDKCAIGINYLDQPSVKATNNTFNIGNATFPSIVPGNCFKSVGIYSTECLYPVIEENTFTAVTKSNSNVQRIGTIMQDCDVNDKRIYRNIYSGLELSSVSLGKNGMLAAGKHSSGLTMICNNYSSNSYDLYFESSNSGAHPTQGTMLLSGAYLSAGNTFASSSTNIYNFSKFFVDYFYSGAGTNPTSRMVITQPIYVTATSNANTCKSKYKQTFELAAEWNYDPNSTSWNSIKSLVNTEKTSYDSLKTIYTAKWGNQSLLTNYINARSIDDSVTVKDSMLKRSPYLAETTIIALCNKHILNTNSLMRVLSANKTALRSETLMDYLDNTYTPALSSTNINALKDSASKSDARNLLEGQMATVHADMENHVNVLSNFSKMDTLGTGNDSLGYYYDKVADVQAAYQKVNWLVENGNYTTANSLMTSIPSTYQLSTSDNQVHQLYRQLFNVLRTAKQAGRSMSNLTSTELATIQSIQDDAVDIDAIQIINKTKVVLTPFVPVRICPNFAGAGMRLTGKTSSEETENEEQPLQDHFKVYPNPASDHVTFDYNFADASSTLILSVTNTIGTKVIEERLSGNNGSFKWDTRNVSTGVYIYRLFDGKDVVETGKVMISK
jgi:hypothetical protein